MGNRSNLGFSGHGGVVVASCYHAKIDEMRALTRRKGHGMCVCWDPNDDVMFGFNYGHFVKKLAKPADDVLVITGDDEEEGMTQQKEMEFLRRLGVRFQKMTLNDYNSRWPPSSGAASTMRKWVVTYKTWLQDVHSSAFDREADAQNLYNCLGLWCTCALYRPAGDVLKSWGRLSKFEPQFLAAWASHNP